MNCLCLDFGTKTGYCYNQGSEIVAGTWILATAKEIKEWGLRRLTRRKDPRVERLCSKLSNLGHFDMLVFEDCEFITYQKQAQLWSSFRTVSWLCGRASNFECVPVGSLKKFATGAGNADKETMAKFLLLNPKFANSARLDDNGVDACWLWLWAQENLSRMRTIFR